MWETDCIGKGEGREAGRKCRAGGRVTVRGGQPLLGRGGELRIPRWDTGVREGEQESRGCRRVGTWDRDSRESRGYEDTWTGHLEAIQMELGGGGGGWVQKLELQALSQLGSTLDGHQADLLLHLGIHSERGTAPPLREHTFTKGGLLCVSYERSGETGSIRCLGSESQTTPAVWDGAHIPAVPQASHTAPGAQEALAKQPALLTCEKEPLQSLQGGFWVFC